MSTRTRARWETLQCPHAAELTRLLAPACVHAHAVRSQLVASLRNDGRAPAAYIADTTTANAQVGWGPGVWGVGTCARSAGVLES